MALAGSSSAIRRYTVYDVESTTSRPSVGGRWRLGVTRDGLRGRGHQAAWQSFNAKTFMTEKSPRPRRASGPQADVT